jgi:hypothetical protein
MTALERFMAKVETLPNGCWQWTAFIDWYGYGRFGLNGKSTTAHRAAYVLLVGEIPAETQIDHLCRNRGCVNPAHLETVTQKTNAERGARAMRTHCKHGHPFDAQNTHWRGGTRECRACWRRRSAQYKQSVKS